LANCNTVKRRIGSDSHLKELMNKVKTQNQEKNSGEIDGIEGGALPFMPEAQTLLTVVQTTVLGKPAPIAA
jgi:hypothetical protein